MKEQWSRLQEQYLQLSIRERVMVLGALLAAMIGAADALILRPMDQERELLEAQLSRSVVSIEHLDERVKLLAERVAGKNPLHLDREELELKRQIETMNSDIEELMSSMIAPADVTRMLEELLSKEGDLTLVKFMSHVPTTSPTSGSATGRGPSDASAVPQGIDSEQPEFYRHGFVIELEGPYLAALHYLESIESLPWDLSWDRITYTVLDYPRARISIQLHTLSREESWIGV